MDCIVFGLFFINVVFFKYWISFKVSIFENIFFGKYLEYMFFLMWI